eukprot:CAMPEP_0203673864 /NCGR_PEP_ID=MMETSP0090-20130426/14153_1 /ASSEMBLY_ACC=CAM_ASM_001088 /TAXON_ID=426623 /ORGANISM="Chaetoceros affinis, Strain CCMP159" /LENGTH=228 /DNA_ID=CAMNT_0050539601 /DNA_START=61 /DNA_END=747 /DNA_ORIENTATION=-
MSNNKGKKAAVILAGNGVYDGSECTEVISTLIHLDKHGVGVTCFAPTMKQKHVINHIKGEEMEGERDVAVESARLARGKVSDLASLSAKDFDAVFVPGGFGVAKNLSTYAFDGAAGMTILPEVERVLKEFHELKKPIALCCIAPVLGCKLFPNAEFTFGKKSGDGWPYAGTSEDCEKLGCKIMEKESNEFHVDDMNKIVTAPAYMNDNTPYGIFENVGQWVTAALELI